jgi:alkanesulfonate monooxygenase SsuD/methylene tetrahydromethanopterin reductase-like flavin-dependent oxidoreductase (luciferase family)
VAGRPPILRRLPASGLGREFATRNADFLFTSVIDFERSREEIAELRSQAAAQGR